MTVLPVAIPYLPAPRVPTVYRGLRSRLVADACGAPVLREQVDLDALHGELLAVIDQTMQHTQAWLWLRPAAVPRPR